MARRATKRERLEARITPEQKALFEQAAGLQGCSLTAFIVRSAQAAAEAAVRSHQIVLSARDSALLVEALLNPSPPNEHLRKAVRRHRELIGEP